MGSQALLLEAEALDLVEVDTWWEDKKEIANNDEEDEEDEEEEDEEECMIVTVALSEYTTLSTPSHSVTHQP